MSGTSRGVAEVSLCHVERFVSVSETRWWSRAGALSYSRWETLSLSLKHTHLHTHPQSACCSLMLPACPLQFALQTEIFETEQLEQNNSRWVPGAQLRSLDRCSSTQSLFTTLSLSFIELYCCTNSFLHTSALLCLSSVDVFLCLLLYLSPLRISRYISQLFYVYLHLSCIHLFSHRYVLLFIHLCANSPVDLLLSFSSSSSLSGNLTCFSTYFSLLYVLISQPSTALSFSL